MEHGKSQRGMWFKRKQPPAPGVIICPLCNLPEDDEYDPSCACWDDHCEECGHPEGSHAPGCTQDESELDKEQP